MAELQLFSGPRLVSKSWFYDGDKESGEWVFADVTDLAHEYLFHDIEADPNVTLANVFKLVMDQPVMQAVFRQDFVEELCDEVRKGSIQKEEEAWERIEFLELYQRWDKDTSINTFTSGVGRYYLHGVGIVQDADIYEHDYLAHKNGERIKWSVSLTPVRELLHLPIRVNTEVIICEDDIDAKQYAQKLQAVMNTRITLGSYIREILWELSWHGTPAASKNVANGLKDQMAEIEAGTATTQPYDDSFRSQSERIVYDEFFVGSDALDLAEIYHALHELEDIELAQDGLKRLLDGKLQIRSEFAELTGRQLRKAVRETRPGKDE